MENFSPTSDQTSCQICLEKIVLVHTLLKSPLNQRWKDVFIIVTLIKLSNALWKTFFAHFTSIHLPERLRKTFPTDFIPAPSFKKHAKDASIHFLIHFVCQTASERQSQPLPPSLCLPDNSRKTISSSFTNTSSSKRPPEDASFHFLIYFVCQTAPEDASLPLTTLIVFRNNRRILSSSNPSKTIVQTTNEKYSLLKSFPFFYFAIEN